MKKRAIWWLFPAVALSLAACKKKEEVKAPEAVPPVASSAQPAVPVPPPVAKTPALGADERAAKLGFVKHLPQDTEVVMAFHNGTKSAERIMSSRVWKLVQDEMGMGMMGEGRDLQPAGEEMEEEEFALPETEQDADAIPEVADAPEEMEEMAEPVGPAALFGTEFTIALGKSTGEQTGNLLTLNRRMGYFQMRSLSKALVEAAKTGDYSSMQSAMADQYGPELLKNLSSDPESGIALFEKLKMPPLYLAFRTKSADREGAAQQIASFTENLGMFEDIVEPVEVEKAGQKFAGHKISGAKVSASMAEDREELDAAMDPASVDKLIAAVAKRDLVVVSGTVGDYVVLFIGASVDELNFASDVSQSLAGSEALAFTDAYASKELAAVIYGQKAMLDTMMSAAGGIADMANGIRDGVAGSEGLGDTRDLETLLRMIGERESALLKMVSNESGGTVAFFEEGLKIESFGGVDKGAVDWKTPNKLASLGDSEDVVMFANMTSDAAYDEKFRAYVEALLETTYAMAMKISELPTEDEQMVQFKEMAKMFDGKFRGDVVSMWDTFNGDFNSSLGSESAFIVDLSGTMPAIPGVPQAVVDEAKFPRISMIAPVTDRAKLAGAWEKMNTGTTGILAKISEMTGQDIPMQKPISSEKNGYTTWFFPLPFFNDDFMPSVTVGDQWFAASTSKNQALDLVEKAAKGGETRNGLIFTMNFKAMQKFISETNKVMAKNSGDIGIGAEELEMMSKASTAMEDLDKLTLHSRREAGVLRTSIHFKTR